MTKNDEKYARQPQLKRAKRVESPNQGARSAQRASIKAREARKEPQSKRAKRVESPNQSARSAQRAPIKAREARIKPNQSVRSAQNAPKCANKHADNAPTVVNCTSKIQIINGRLNRTRTSHYTGPAVDKVSSLIYSVIEFNNGSFAVARNRI